MARVVLFLVSCLLAQALCVPAGNRRPGNWQRPVRADSGHGDGDVNSDQGGGDLQITSSTRSSYDIDDDDDDDDDFDSMQTSSSTGGGSNIMSLLNLATALFPSASGATLEGMIRRVIRDYFIRNPVILRRQDVADNVIEIDYVNGLTPPFLRQEDEDSADTNESDSNGDDDDSSSGSAENDNAAEESIEENNTGNDNAPKQDSGLNDDGGNGDDDDSDYSDEPPGGGDGQGGGVLGLLAGLSGGEDGQSDLGSLLAAVSGIVGSLSGDGFDLNSLIATAFGLFVGLLSEGEENPGSIIASYLLTSLDTITGGGSKNNGAFIGNFISKLVKGTSAGSSGGASEQQSPLWIFKMDLLRSVLQFGASILGIASSSVTKAITV